MFYFDLKKSLNNNKKNYKYNYFFRVIKQSKSNEILELIKKTPKCYLLDLKIILAYFGYNELAKIENKEME